MFLWLFLFFHLTTSLLWGKSWQFDGECRVLFLQFFVRFASHVVKDSRVQSIIEVGEKSRRRFFLSERETETFLIFEFFRYLNVLNKKILFQWFEKLNHFLQNSIDCLHCPKTLEKYQKSFLNIICLPNYANCVTSFPFRIRCP